MNTKEIEELERFFESIEMPNDHVVLNEQYTVTNCKLFVEIHLGFVKAHKNKKVYLPYFERLLMLKEVLEAKV